MVLDKGQHFEADDDTLNMDGSCGRHLVENQPDPEVGELVD